MNLQRTSPTFCAEFPHKVFAHELTKQEESAKNAKMLSQDSGNLFRRDKNLEFRVHQGEEVLVNSRGVMVNWKEGNLSMIYLPARRKLIPS